MGGSALERQSRSDTSQNKNIKQFYVMTENWREKYNDKKRGHNEHDLNKIFSTFFYKKTKNPFGCLISSLHSLPYFVVRRNN
jgi:hypothetical protein